MHNVIVLENLCFLPSIRKREFGVFKSPLWGPLSGDLFFWCPSIRKREFGVFKSPLWGPLSGDLFFWCPKRPFSCGRKAKNTLIRVDGALNSCSQMLRLYRYDANESTLYEQNISSAQGLLSMALHEHHAYLYFASSSAARLETS